MKNENNIETWLEKKFPKQFMVEQSLRDIHPKNFHLNKHTSLIAAASDHDVQFELVWFKDQENLGLTVEEVKTKLEQRTNEAAQARDWFKKLTAAGLEKISVGVIDSALYILPFVEPDAKMRHSIIEKVLTVLQQENNSTQASIFVECMEDSEYRKELKEIIPFGYWRRKDTYHDDHKIISVDFEYSSATEADVVKQNWTFNTKSNRSLKYMEQAFAESRKWADEHGDKAHYLESVQMVQFELDNDNPLLVHYYFPLYPSKPADSTAYGVEDSAIGYITGIFDTDTKTFTHIKKVKSLNL